MRLERQRQFRDIIQNEKSQSTNGVYLKRAEATARGTHNSSEEDFEKVYT